MSDWQTFYRNTKDRPPSPLLVKALASAKLGGRALDLGAGALKDTRHLLAEGFEVTAVDREPALADMAAALGSPKLHACVSSFDAFAFPEDAYDIASSMYALPFNSPETFDAVFGRLKRSLAPGGVFCGQLFGRRDAWRANPAMTFHDEAAVRELLAGLDILSLEEREWDGKLADGTPKHWHVFEIVARKPALSVSPPSGKVLS